MKQEEDDWQPDDETRKALQEIWTHVEGGMSLAYMQGAFDMLLRLQYHLSRHLPPDVSSVLERMEWARKRLLSKVPEDQRAELLRKACNPAAEEAAEQNIQ
jgi:hypothetical protein